MKKDSMNKHHTSIEATCKIRVVLLSMTKVNAKKNLLTKKSVV